jgi:hypothetical protein
MPHHASNAILMDLRTLLAERFGSAFRGNFPGQFSNPIPDSASAPALAAEGLHKFLPTGLPDWDALTQGLRLGEVTEICGALGSTSLILDALLEAFSKAGWNGAWVDAADTLEVEDWELAQRERLLWVRCQEVSKALKAADLLLRDGQSNWVILDLQCSPLEQLQRIASNHWHRFHRVVEQQQNSLLVLSPAPLVEGARVRITPALSSALTPTPNTPSLWPLDALEQPRRELRPQLSLHVFVRGRLPLLQSTANPTPLASEPAPRALEIPQSFQRKTA